MVRSCCSSDSFVDSAEVKLKSPFKEPDSFPQKPPQVEKALDLGGMFTS